MAICAETVAKLNSDIRGKNFYTALELEKSGQPVLKLNTGNPATFGFPMPESVRNALVQKLPTALGYCDVRGMLPARQAIAQYHSDAGLTDFSLEDIFIGNGISEIASMVCTALFDPGDEVLVPTPCYSLWVNELLVRQAKPVYYRCDEENRWNPDPEHIKSLITPKTKAIVLINPNNPTGVVYDEEILLELAQIARQNNLTVLSDEIYDRLIFDGKHFRSFSCIAPDLNVITMNGLSKSHCLCGFRCGWLVLTGAEAFRQQVNEALLKLASIRLSANAIMQTVIPEALKDRQYTEAMLCRLNRQREAAFQALDQLNCLTYVKNDAAFYVFPRLKPEYVKYADDREFAHQLLLEKHILIVPGSGFFYEKPDHFRIVMLPEAQQLHHAVLQIGDFIDKC